MRVVSPALLILLSQSTMADDKAPLTGNTWRGNLQAIGQKYQKGTTQAQNTLRWKQVIDEVAKLDKVVVQMASTVKEVRWKNGYAEIYTEPFLPVPERGAPKPPLSTYRTLPFELTMDEEMAASIEPGMPIVFRGTLEFQAKQHGAPGRTLKVQQMHTVKHNELPGTPLGTYTSPDCLVAIGEKVFRPRWAK